MSGLLLVASFVITAVIIAYYNLVISFSPEDKIARYLRFTLSRH